MIFFCKIKKFKANALSNLKVITKNKEIVYNKIVTKKQKTRKQQTKTNKRHHLFRKSTLKSVKSKLGLRNLMLIFCI